MVVEGACDARMHSEGMVYVHGAASRHHEGITNSAAHEKFGDVVGNRHS
jgi:hypothetical protein